MLLFTQFFTHSGAREMIAIGRIVQETEVGRLFQLVTCLSNLPKQNDAEALVIINGLAEPQRTQEVVNIWNEGIGRYLLVTSPGLYERTPYRFTIKELVETFGLTRKSGVYTQVTPVPDTRDHSRWAIEHLKDLGVTSANVYTSFYHMPRTFLTMLRCMIDADIARRLNLYPCPIKISPFEISPEINSPMHTLCEGEAQKIPIYQEKGDIASHEEFMTYIEWMWNQGKDTPRKKRGV